VESLELVKSRYNRNEKALWFITKLRIWIAALMQIYIITIIFVQSNDFYYVTMMQSGIMLFLLIFTL